MQIDDLMSVVIAALCILVSVLAFTMVIVGLVYPGTSKTGIGTLAFVGGSVLVIGILLFSRRRKL